MRIHSEYNRAAVGSHAPEAGSGARTYEIKPGGLSLIPGELPLPQELDYEKSRHHPYRPPALTYSLACSTPSAPHYTNRRSRPLVVYSIPLVNSRAPQPPGPPQVPTHRV
jgi:hypothetical protein